VEAPPSMIRDTVRWQAFERELIAKQKLDHAENLRLVEGMYDLACKLGQFTAEDALDGIEKNIRVAKVINCVRRAS
jgi:hypothetical protein